jgi:hypothetical protein
MKTKRLRMKTKRLRMKTKRPRMKTKRPRMKTKRLLWIKMRTCAWKSLRPQLKIMTPIKNR